MLREYSTEDVLETICRIGRNNLDMEVMKMCPMLMLVIEVTNTIRHENSLILSEKFGINDIKLTCPKFENKL